MTEPTVPLQVYIDEQLRALKEYHDAQTRALQEEIDRRFTTARTTFRDYVEEQTHLNDLGEKSIQSRFAERDKALNAHYEALEKRLDQANEIRAVLRDQQGTFITRAEHNLIIDRITSVEKTQAIAQGKYEQTVLNIQSRMWIVATVITILSIVVGVILHFVTI